MYVYIFMNELYYKLDIFQVCSCLLTFIVILYFEIKNYMQCIRIYTYINIPYTPSYPKGVADYLVLLADIQIYTTVSCLLLLAWLGSTVFPFLLYTPMLLSVILVSFSLMSSVPLFFLLLCRRSFFVDVHTNSVAVVLSTYFNTDCVQIHF